MITIPGYKIKMWCLIHKPKNKIIKIHSGNSYVIGFDTKKDLMEAIKVDGQDYVEYDEQIVKVTGFL